MNRDVTGSYVDATQQRHKSHIDRAISYIACRVAVWRDTLSIRGLRNPSAGQGLEICGHLFHESTRQDLSRDIGQSTLSWSSTSILSRAFLAIQSLFLSDESIRASNFYHCVIAILARLNFSRFASAFA